MNQPTPDMNTTGQTEMTSISEPNQRQSRVMKVLYPNLSESIQNHVEMVVESPQVGTEQTLPLIPPTETPPSFHYQVLQRIGFSILPMFLGLILSAQRYISDEFIIQKRGTQYEIKWPFKLAIFIQICLICLLPQFRQKSLIIRYQKYIYLLEILLLIPLFIGIWRLLCIIDYGFRIIILIIEILIILLLQRMNIVLKKPQPTLNGNYFIQFQVVKYLIYISFGVNGFLAMLGVDMQYMIITESLAIYSLYYFIQLNDSFNTENNFKPILHTIVQYCFSPNTSTQPAQTHIHRVFLIVRNILAFIGAIALIELVHQFTEFPIYVYLIWSITANTQIVNATAKLTSNDSYLAAFLFFADIFNFIPNIIRTIAKSN